MRLVQTCKSIRIDSGTLNKIKAAEELLDSIYTDLLELSKEDEHFTSIKDSAWDAYARVSDFLDHYECIARHGG